MDVSWSLNRGIESSIWGDGCMVSDVCLGYDNVGEFRVSIMAITDSQSEDKPISWICALGMTLSLGIISKARLNSSTESNGLGVISELQP
jgi:hypothetical protein